MTGTTPVTIIKHTLSHYEGFHLPTLADDLVFHQFGAVCGDEFSDSYLKRQFPLILYIQMESNPDSAALAQQVQTLVATIEELTKQNQEMKLRLQQVQQA